MVGKDVGAKGFLLELLDEHLTDGVGIGKRVPEGETRNDLRGLSPVTEDHGTIGNGKTFAGRFCRACAAVARLIAFVLKETFEGL